jgi:hypothetical protein
MSIQFQLLPLFVQVLLTFVVLLTLAGRRYGAVRAGEVRGSVALRERNWPPYTQQAEFNYQNQFELPVLFYVLTILAIYTRHADLLFVLMAWVFVVLRVLHALVHVTSNKISFRGPVFAASAIVLMIMWAIFAARILLGLP